jgi:hypothetical protein
MGKNKNKKAAQTAEFADEISVKNVDKVSKASSKGNK